MLSSVMKMATAVVQSVLSSSNSNGGVPTRPKCVYGAKCYRKNLQHKLEESHPHEDPSYEQQWILLHQKEEPAKPDTNAASASSTASASASDSKPATDRRPSKRKADESTTASSESGSTDTDRPDTVRRVRSKPTTNDETVPASASSSSPSPTASSATAAAASHHLLSPKSPVGSDGETVSPRVDKKMSVKERKALAAQSRTNSNESLNLSLEASNISTPTSSSSSAANTSNNFPPAPPQLSTAASFSSTPLIASLSSTGAHSSLMLFHEVRAPPSAQVKSGAIVVGRAQGNMKDAEGKDVSIGFVLQSADKMISRLHAKIEWSRSLLPTSSRSNPPSFEYHWSISDQNSLNGIFVNNLKISSLPNAKRVLQDRDLITFGGGQGVAEGTLIKQNEKSAKGITLVFRCKAFTGPEGEKKEKELKEEMEEKPTTTAADASGTRRSSSPPPPLLRKTSSTATVATKRVLAQQLNESTTSTAATTTPVSSAKKPRTAGGRSAGRSPSPPISRSPSRSRSRSPQIRMQIDEATYDQSSTTQNFDSATQGYGSGVPSSYGSSATQDYHDDSRLEDRRVAALSDTQDFSSSLHPPNSYGTATQDGGNF